MATKIIVAGATGHLGGMIVNALLERGADVHAVVRPGTSGSRLEPLERLGVTLHPVDLAPGAALAEACAGAKTVVSALQGLQDVIVTAQGHLLDAAAAAGVERFIPSDYSIDFTRFPAGLNRNLDLRRSFHEQLDRSAIAGVSIFNGAFGELLTTVDAFIDRKAGQVGYWGDADQPMDFTTMPNTAEFTAAAALDAPPVPRALHCAGGTASARELAQLTGFALVRRGGLDDLAGLIQRFRQQAPASEQEVFPAWQGMQYMHNMASGFAAPRPLDNDRYPGIRWTTIPEILAGGPVM